MMVGRVSSPHPSHLDEFTKATYALLEEDVCDRLDPYHMVVHFDASASELITSLFASCQTQGLHLSMVIGYAHDRVLQKASEVAQEHYDHECVHLYHILLHECKHHTQVMSEELKVKMEALNHDDRLTFKMYLEYHMNALLAADALYVHRNTFNYRLNKAIDASGINIKIQPFALLLQLYFTCETLR
jgi:sugar diacid utilization regulator